MRLFFTIPLLLIGLNTYGQKNEPIYSNSLVLGVVVDKNYHLSEKISECDMMAYSVTLDIGDIVPISSVVCQDFCYEVYYNGKYYLAIKSGIIVDTNQVNQLKSMSKDTLEAHRKECINQWSLIILTKLNDELNQKKRALEFVNSTKVKGLMIVKNRIYDESEYTSGTSLEVEFYNPTKKVVKYITISYAGYNAVDDIVTDPIRRKSILSQRFIGPIKPEENATYEIKYAWMTDIVQSFKITSIKVEYMDGTIKIINKPSDIIISDEDYSTLTDNND
jgi:hypothetical protein